MKDRRLRLLKPESAPSSEAGAGPLTPPSPRGGEGAGGGGLPRPGGERVGVRGIALAPGVMIASLRGRILARRELLPQSEGDRERLEHERAIADYDSEIARIEKAGIEQAGAGA